MAAARSRRPRRLPRRFYLPDARELAPQLLNKLLVHGARRGRIVEVEAYVGGGIDPGSHAFGGQTRRNATMFGPPGHLYVYFTYGMHWCANVVCEPAGTASALLLRAVVPLAGLEEMRPLRPRAHRDLDLCNGPAKLCQAFSITGAHDGADLVAGTGPAVYDDGTPPPEHPTVTTRIGLSAGADLPWRWLVPDSPHVSRWSAPRISPAREQLPPPPGW